MCVTRVMICALTPHQSDAFRGLSFRCICGALKTTFFFFFPCQVVGAAFLHTHLVSFFPKGVDSPLSADGCKFHGRFVCRMYRCAKLMLIFFLPILIKSFFFLTVDSFFVDSLFGVSAIFSENVYFSAAVARMESPLVGFGLRVTC